MHQTTIEKLLHTHNRTIDYSDNEKHSEVSFSHGMCPECSDGLYGKEDWYIEMKKEEK